LRDREAARMRVREAARMRDRDRLGIYYQAITGLIDKVHFMGLKSRGRSPIFSNIF
jgi:hypothetical protein